MRGGGGGERIVPGQVALGCNRVGLGEHHCEGEGLERWGRRAIHPPREGPRAAVNRERAAPHHPLGEGPGLQLGWGRGGAHHHPGKGPRASLESGRRTAGGVMQGGVRQKVTAGCSSLEWRGSGWRGQKDKGAAQGQRQA